MQHEAAGAPTSQHEAVQSVATERVSYGDGRTCFVNHAYPSMS